MEMTRKGQENGKRDLFTAPILSPVSLHFPTILATVASSAASASVGKLALSLCLPGTLGRLFPLVSLSPVLTPAFCGQPSRVFQPLPVA